MRIALALSISLSYEFGMTVPERLKRARKKLGKSQQQIANEVGCTQPLVSQWENGDGLPPTERVRAVAAAYGLRPELLLPDEHVA
jgi:transcriptional regulator with XRE-family HTH domain